MGLTVMGTVLLVIGASSDNGRFDANELEVSGTVTSIREGYASRRGQTYRAVVTYHFGGQAFEIRDPIESGLASTLGSRVAVAVNPDAPAAATLIDPQHALLGPALIGFGISWIVFGCIGEAARRLKSQPDPVVERWFPAILGVTVATMIAWAGFGSLWLWALREWRVGALIGVILCFGVGSLAVSRIRQQPDLRRSFPRSSA